MARKYPARTFPVALAQSSPLFLLKAAFAACTATSTSSTVAAGILPTKTYSPKIGQWYWATQKILKKPYKKKFSFFCPKKQMHSQKSELGRTTWLPQATGSVQTILQALNLGYIIILYLQSWTIQATENHQLLKYREIVSDQICVYYTWASSTKQVPNVERIFQQEILWRSNFIKEKNPENIIMIVEKGNSY